MEIWTLKKSLSDLICIVQLDSNMDDPVIRKIIENALNLLGENPDWASDEA